MMGGVIVAPFLVVLLLSGFAYLIWTVSAKETGNVKLVGQVIAILIAVFALVILLYGGIYCGMMGGGAGCPMMKHGMMKGM